MNRIFGYSRSNRGKVGLQYQNELISQYANKRNLKLELYSDSNLGTQIGTQLQRLISNVPNNSEIVITNRARISRNSNDYQLIVNEFKSKNVKLTILDEERWIFLKK